MRILGLDTATRCASVGILIDGTVVAEASQLADASHAASLLPLIANTLERGRCRVRDLDAIAVSSGPGSFTGLRIGMSVAKGLARACGLRLVGVPTLEALASTVAAEHRFITTLLDARKGELYVASFEAAHGGVQRLTPDQLVTPESLLGVVPTPCAILGDAVIAYRDFLEARLGARVTVLPFPEFAPRGGVIAARASERLQSAAPDDVPTLEPFYIRPSDATAKAL